ncbi:hypothetical protein HPB48_020117 [Haemaphysalis longicornis]|uniref:MULE transposase domain-containing protein n=1 Tax=Haemaphysalis longicornis TaxID=44386 RepID=A0A9J6FBM7_HAELO|nr:hypothetical protein HPB48_020117 [Haemaphysalis longicornis]
MACILVAVIPIMYASLSNKKEETYQRLFSVLLVWFLTWHSVYRKLCKFGMQARYSNDEEFAVQMRMLPALPFLPVSEVPDAFDDLLEGWPSCASDLAMYFEDTYIGRRRRNGIQSALFPPHLWSVHEAVQQDLPRTNNSVEAWHRGFQTQFDAESPAADVSPQAAQWKVREARAGAPVINSAFVEPRDGSPRFLGSGTPAPSPPFGKGGRWSGR